MSKELEALDSIRKAIKDAFHYPLNLTPEYSIIKQALDRLAMFEELFVKMDLELEIEIGDDSWGTSQDYGTYVRGENSNFEELYVTDDETVMLISKLKENEIETMYEDMTSELTKMEWKEHE